MIPDKIQLSMIRGAIAKSFVVKHYKGGKVVVTKYPNMKGIVASKRQRVRRKLFKRAVTYAQKVFANPALKEEKRRMLRRPRRLFQALMKEWFKARKERAYWRVQRIERWQRNLKENGGLAVILNMINRQKEGENPPFSEAYLRWLLYPPFERGRAVSG